MNRYIIYILLLFAAPSYGQQNRMSFLLNKLNDGGKSDYVMIFAHRGAMHRKTLSKLTKAALMQALTALKSMCK